MARAENITPALLKPRINSLDQFRGYTMAGMFLVNYMSGPDAFPNILKHHHNYCSYSDTIMPQFLFAVGFSLRLTFGRRVQEQGIISAYGRMFRRLMGLGLAAMCIHGVGKIENWNQLYNPNVEWWRNLWFVLHDPLKRDWTQTLGQIALTSLWILPVLRAHSIIRIIWMLLSMAAHIYVSYNAHIFDGIFLKLSSMGAFLWVNGGLAGDAGPSGVDGGSFGFLTWTIPAIMGTIACDAVVGTPGRPKLGRLALWSVVLMGGAYVISCGTRLYDVPEAKTQEWLAERAAIQELAKSNEKEPDEAKKKAVAGEIGERLKTLNSNKFPADPVWPDKSRWEGKSWMNLLAEPPLIGRPPNPEREKALASIQETDDAKTRKEKKQYPEDWYYRQWNYWMMSQRGGTVAYPMFGAGFSILVYLLFYIVCDKWGITFFVFRTFGVNALLGYVLQDIIGSNLVQRFMPGDPPNWYAWANFGVYFLMMYIFLRFFEKNKIFIRM